MATARDRRCTACGFPTRSPAQQASGKGGERPVRRVEGFVFMGEHWKLKSKNGSVFFCLCENCITPEFMQLAEHKLGVMRDQSSKAVSREKLNASGIRKKTKERQANGK